MPYVRDIQPTPQTKPGETSPAHSLAQIFRAVLDSVSDGIIVCDHAGKVLCVSRSAMRLLDLSPNMGDRSEKSFEIIDGEVPLAFDEMPLQVALRGVSIVDRELTVRVPNRDDVEIRVSADPLTSPTGEQVGAAVVFRDITADKRAERLRERLLQQLAIHKKALDEFAIVSEISPGRQITYVNENFCRASQYSRGEILGQTHELLDSGEHDPSFFEGLWSTVQAGHLWRGEIKNRAKDGTDFWVDTTVVPFRREDGNGDDKEELRLLSLQIPITERKVAEAARIELDQKLREASRQAGMAEVATGVLHNVGNILNSINVSTECIRSAVDSSRVEGMVQVAALLREHDDRLPEFLTEDERGRHFPAYFAEATHHFADLKVEVLRELDELSKYVEHVKHVVRGQQTLARNHNLKESVKVRDLISDAAATLGQTFSKHQIALETDLSGSETVVTDKHKVLQVIVNLLANACEASAQFHNGKVGAGRNPRSIRVESEDTLDGTFLIRVVDNGVGIPAEHLAQVFQHGFTTRPDGHGFGLHTCALVAKELGGALSVASDGPSTGATFTLTLPNSSAQEAIAC